VRSVTAVSGEADAMVAVSIRSATAEDVERIVEMRAQRYSAERVRLDGIPNPSKGTVVSDRIVGVTGTVRNFV